MREPIIERTKSRVHEMSVRRRRNDQCDCKCQPEQNQPWPAHPHTGSPEIAFQRKKTPPHSNDGARKPQGYAPGRPSMGKTDSDAERVKEAGCDHETDAIKHTAGTSRQFGAVGMPVGNGKDANNNCRNPELRTSLAKHSKPQRQSRQRDTQFNAWELDSHQSHHAAQSHDHRENYRQYPYCRSAELRAPHPHRDHREDMVESGDGMLEAAGKADCLATALVGECRERVEEKEENYERAAGRSCALAEVSHGVIPKSIAARWIVQNAPSDPTVYPGSAWTQRGQRISNCRNERSRSKIKSTNDIWPISTPTLKLSSASGKSLCGKPALVSAPAKPKP